MNIYDFCYRNGDRNWNVKRIEANDLERAAAQMADFMRTLKDGCVQEEVYLVLNVKGMDDLEPWLVI